MKVTRGKGVLVLPQVTRTEVDSIVFSRTLLRIEFETQPETTS